MVCNGATGLFFVMNILVTVSAGMIGGYVVKGLTKKGHTVIGVDRVKSKIEYEGLTHVIHDLSSKDDVMRAFGEYRIDRCIHLAALAHTVGVKIHHGKHSKR